MAGEWLIDPWGIGEELLKPGEMKKISTLSPEQQELMKKVSAFTEPRIGEGLPAWEGDWTIPQTEEEKWGMGRYREAVEGMDPEAVSDCYMKYIAPGEQKYLEEVSIPTFKESMVPGGTLRGTGTERGIADIISKFGTGQLGRIGGTIMEERTAGRAALPGYMEAAALPRMIEQEELNREIQEFVRTTPELNPILNLVMQIMNVGTQAAFYQPSLLETILPALGQAAGMAAGAA